MPMTNRLAILLDGAIFDIDSVDSLVGRYSPRGYTVVLHLKDEVNIKAIFARHFREFVINDTSEVGALRNIEHWFVGRCLSLA